MINLVDYTVKQINDLELLAEIAMFQETGKYPHEYMPSDRELMMDIFAAFSRCGISRAERLVFTNIRKKFLNITQRIIPK